MNEDETDLHAIHRRNVEHLAQYVRARREHIERAPDCTSGPLCVGPVAMFSMRARSRIHPVYLKDLVLSAIAMLGDREDIVAEAGARSMRLDLELADARAELGEVRARLEDVASRLEACEPIVGDDRTYRPQG